MLRSHLFFIDLIINRKLVYGTLTVLLTLVYVSLIFGLQYLFVVVYHGQAKDYSGKPHVGLSAKAQINRKDFGLTWNMLLETDGVLVGEEAKIEVDLQAVSQEEKEDSQDEIRLYSYGQSHQSR